MRATARHRPHLRRRHRGFTLIEAAIVTVIVGVGTVAMIQLLAAGSVSNGKAYQLTTGLNLANNIRELTQTLRFNDSSPSTTWGPDSGETLATYDDINDFHNWTSPAAGPIDAMRQTITEFADWQQSVIVQKVDENCVTLPVASTADSSMARVTVRITKGGEEVCQSSWMVVDTD